MVVEALLFESQLLNSLTFVILSTLAAKCYPKFPTKVTSDGFNVILKDKLIPYEYKSIEMHSMSFRNRNSYHMNTKVWNCLEFEVPCSYVWVSSAPPSF